MTKLCLRCNSQLPDPNAVLCPACEAKLRLQQEAREAVKPKPAASVEDVQPHVADQTSPPVIDQSEAQHSRCTICFREFFGIGDYCLDCARKLNHTPEEWAAEKQKDNAARTYNILVKSAVGIGVLLVLSTVGWGVTHVQPASPPHVVKPIAPAPQSPTPSPTGSTQDRPYTGGYPQRPQSATSASGTVNSNRSQQQQEPANDAAAQQQDQADAHAAQAASDFDSNQNGFDQANANIASSLGPQIQLTPTMLQPLGTYYQNMNSIYPYLRRDTQAQAKQILDRDAIIMRQWQTKLSEQHAGQGANPYLY